MIQNWFPPLTGNTSLDNSLRNIVQMIYSLSASLSKQISALPKASTPASSTVSTYNGPTQQTFPTRTFATNYQNSNTVPMWITITISMVSSGSGNAIAQAFTDSFPTPSTPVADVELNNAGASSVAVNMPMTFVVLPGNFYRVTTTGGSIVSWVEWF